ncbi:MAG: DedA family protein [Akkermansia sp.]|nr:DedA family protein [Akkermansia sp.]MBR7109017.1 DedA family protein [Akkermansia sp.]
MEWVKAWEYLGVVILMAMESSIIPVPSEVVVPPAAILAAMPGSNMSFWGVVLAGTAGSYIGSVIMYYTALWAGRPFIYKFGKYFFMPKHKVEKAEDFMRRYATGGIFFSRFLPVIRHLISIPAGMAKVNFFKFSLSTITGSAIWCWVLAWFGDKVGRNNPELLNSPEELMAAIKAESHLIVLGVVLLAALYAIMKYMTRPKNNQQDSADKAE